VSRKIAVEVLAMGVAALAAAISPELQGRTQSPYVVPGRDVRVPPKHRKAKSLKKARTRV
jgi:hypothetical protein